MIRYLVEWADGDLYIFDDESTARANMQPGCVVYKCESISRLCACGRGRLNGRAVRCRECLGEDADATIGGRGR